MNLASKTLIFIMSASLILMIPKFSMASSWDYSRSSVSESEPDVYKSAEEDIPVRTETKVSGWTWLVLALLAGGGAAAALSGGGKGSSSNSSANTNTPTSTSSTGEAAVRW